MEHPKNKVMTVLAAAALIGSELKEKEESLNDIEIEFHSTKRDEKSSSSLKDVNILLDSVIE